MTTPLPSNPTPPELRELEAALDRLARFEADAAPPGFAERIARATFATPAHANNPAIISFGSRRFVPSGWRVAASMVILLAGGSLASWLALRTPASRSSPEVASADASLVTSVWSAVDEAWADEAWARNSSTQSEVDRLRASMDALATNDWTASDFIDDSWLSDSL